jgi:hypothetical protein
VNLSGGETLVFYGGGEYYNASVYDYNQRKYYTKLNVNSIGGYLSTKSTYSGTAYVKVGSDCYNNSSTLCSKAIGLFVRDSVLLSDFIAGAGAGGQTIYSYDDGKTYSPYDGGGWGSESCTYRWLWFFYSQITLRQSPYAVYYNIGQLHDNDPIDYSITEGQVFPPGFCSGFRVTGGASSISALHNIPTKQYTSLSTSFAMTGGGLAPPVPTLYVCK